MRIIGFIEDLDAIKKIASSLGLWNVKRKPLPRANAPPIDAISVYHDSPSPSVDDYLTDPEYPDEAYLQ